VSLTTGEAARYCRCRMSTKQLLRYATSGRLAGEQLVAGGRWRFHIDELDAFLRSPR
jgi:excisionase family DNA binding protein